MSIPTLNFPSRTAAVIALRRLGFDTGEIAAQCGVNCNYVITVEHKAAKRKKNPVPPFRELGQTILLPNAIIDQLTPYAARRSIEPSQLARRILTVVAEAGIIDAVLDDADELAG